MELKKKSIADAIRAKNVKAMPVEPEEELLTEEEINELLGPSEDDAPKVKLSMVDSIRKSMKAKV